MPKFEFRSPEDLVSEHEDYDILSVGQTACQGAVVLAFSLYLFLFSRAGESLCKQLRVSGKFLVLCTVIKSRSKPDDYSDTLEIILSSKGLRVRNLKDGELVGDSSISCLMTCVVGIAHREKVFNPGVLIHWIVREVKSLAEAKLVACN